MHESDNLAANQVSLCRCGGYSNVKRLDAPYGRIPVSQLYARDSSVRIVR